MHPHGPLFPRQLVPHSPTHLDNAGGTVGHDRCNPRGHSRRALVTASRHPGFRSWIVHHSTLRRNFAGEAELHFIHAAAGQSVLATLQVARSVTTWPNTSQSSSWNPSPTSNVSIWTLGLIRAFNSTERRQLAASDCRLALPRLDRGGQSEEP